MFARQAWADDVPTHTAVCRLEKNVAGVIKNVRVNGREEDGRCAKKSVLAAADGFGRDVLNLARRLVEARELTAVDEVRIQRIGRDVAVLFGSHGSPVAE